MMNRVVAAIALLVMPVAAVSGCSSGAKNPSSSTTGSSSAGKLTTQLNTADGKHVADATIDFTSGYATVTVETVVTGVLSPGFHGMHIHAVGTCEANSAAPGGGQANFASAGDHFQAPGHTGQPASGDLPPLLVRSDGSGKLVATTDAFTEGQLKGSQGSSIVLHQDADMESQSAASDKRIACGVLSPASAATTSVSTSTSTSTVTATVPTVPPATTTYQTPSSAPTTTSTSTSTSPSTITSTVTITPVPPR
jgi:Cu-Zn family superoxide dismutase